MNKILGGLVFVLVIAVAILAWLLFVQTAHAPTTQEPLPTQKNTEVPTSTSDTPAPLHERVHVTSPLSGGTVGKTFGLTGDAPGNWFFEATFPIQVRDPQGNVIAHAHGNAIGDWMTTEQVKFATTVSIETNYTGQATLIIMKDNPSGLPEKDDSLEIPIVVK